MMAVLESLPDSAQEQLRTTDPPTWTEPMLATLTDRRFSDEGWLFERKLDGERCLTFRNGTDGRLRSRNQKTLNAPYPELVAQIGFEEWTHDDRLRQPRFQGLRRDKEPTDVIKEEPPS